MDSLGGWIDHKAWFRLHADSPKQHGEIVSTIGDVLVMCTSTGSQISVGHALRGTLWDFDWPDGDT